MKCLRCGYCCDKYDVSIVDDPELGIVEGNVVNKPTGERCRHLRGKSPGEYSCAIHDKIWYKETPCFAFTQYENGNTPCRMGVYVLEKIEK